MMNTDLHIYFSFPSVFVAFIKLSCLKVQKLVVHCWTGLTLLCRAWQDEKRIKKKLPFPCLVLKKSWPRRSRLPNPKVYKGFHSTSPNLTTLPKIACVCDENHPSAEEACLTVCFLLGAVRFAFPLWTGLELWCDIRGPASSHSLFVLLWADPTQVQPKAQSSVCRKRKITIILNAVTVFKITFTFWPKTSQICSVSECALFLMCCVSYLVLSDASIPVQKSNF